MVDDEQREVKPSQEIVQETENSEDKQEQEIIKEQEHEVESNSDDEKLV